MENAPSILLFWAFAGAVFMLVIALGIAAIVFTKKGKKQNSKKMHLLGKVCLCLSIICSVPILTVFGYTLYLLA